MSIAANLEKLAELHRSGGLTQEEFVRAKLRVLDEEPVKAATKGIVRRPVDTDKLLSVFHDRPQRMKRAELTVEMDLRKRVLKFIRTFAILLLGFFAILIFIFLVTFIVRHGGITISIRL